MSKTTLIAFATPGLEDWARAVTGATVVETGGAGELQRRLEAPGHRVVGFYGAPWTLAPGTTGDGDGDADPIARWTACAAALAAAWQASPDNVVLVNPARAGGAKALPARLEALRIELDAGLMPAADTAPMPRWSRDLLAAAVAEYAPGAWEAYEALESCAQASGEEPELRGTTALGDATDLAWLLGLVGDAARQDAARDRDRRQWKADLEHAVTRMESQEKAAADLRRENELLVHQVEALHQEMATLDAGRGEAEQALRRAQEAIATATATGSAAGEAAVADATRQAELAELQRENELLVLQVEQLHEELESVTGEARSASLVAERATALGERARRIISRLAEERGRPA